MLFFTPAEWNCVQYAGSFRRKTHGKRREWLCCRSFLPGLMKRMQDPTRQNSIGEHRPAVSGVDLYYPVGSKLCIYLWRVDREAPFYLIGYREAYKAKASDLANYLPLASSLASVLQELDDTMLKIEDQQTGRIQIGDYHPIYDYMLFGVRVFLSANFTGDEPEDGKWTTAFTEKSLSAGN